jgi:hypothetical protein
MTGVISKEDEGIFLELFIRNGYVINFSTNDFDVFTTKSIGTALCEKYKKSKGKSLVAFLNSASDLDRTKLLRDLFDYYAKNKQSEYDPDYHNEDIWWEDSNSSYNEKYSKLFLKCKKIIDRLDGVAIATITKTADNLKKQFSSTYLSNQIDLMVEMQTNNPTEAIGKAKELIESCCKTILDDLEMDYKSDNVPQLTSKVMKALNLLPDNINPTARGADSIKAILGNLRAIPTELAKLRNPYGSGHGKSASFQGLEVRHAKLAVGSSITFVDFIWSTYESMKKNND